MRRASWSGVLAAAVGTVVAGALVVPASAANLVFQSSSPVDGSTVASPATLSATYNGALDPNSATVTLRNSGNSVVPTTTPSLSGNAKTVSASPVSTLANGSYTVTFDVQNAALNSHPTPEVIGFTVTATAPPAPSSVVFDGPATATDTVVGLSGAGVSGNTVQVSVDDTDGVTPAVVPGGTVTVVSGQWSTSIDVATLTDGVLTATVTQTDTFGSTSPPSSDATVLKDATAPDAPTSVVFDGPATAIDTVVGLSGNGESGDTVSYSVDDTNGGTTAVTGTTSVAGGSWSASIDVSSLADGTLTATVTQADGVGNVSTAAAPTVLKDTTAPTAPTSVVFDGPATVTDTVVGLSGNGESGDTVSYSVDDTNGGTAPVTGTTTVAGGSWSASIDVSSLADGTLTATVTQADGVGNLSPEATANVVKDSTPPGAPTGVGFDAPAKSGDTAVLLSGDGDNGETVSYSIDDTNGATAAVTGTTSVVDGHWSVSVNVVSLTDGTLTATVRQVDGVGNESSAATATVTKDVAVPAAPSGLLFDGPANAADAQVVLSGAGETGATVTISVDDGDSGTPAVTDTRTVVSGHWTSALLNVAGLDDGTLTATVTQTDGVGNVSSAATKTVLKDVVVPGAPSGLLFDGPANNADTDVVLSGSGESGATVSFTIDDGNVDTPSITGTASVVGGQWSSGLVDVFVLTDGTLTGSATQTDAAGNPSSVSSGTTTAKDTGVPAAPAGLAFDGVVKGSDTVVVLSGSGENGATVSIVVTDTDAGTPAFVRQAVVAGGAWSKTMDLASLTDGTLTATVAQTDAVGNTSNSATKNVLKDTIALAPSPMAFDHPANDENNGLVHLEGSGEPGADVEVRVNDEADGTPVVLPNNAVVVDDGGSWSAELYVSSLQDGAIIGRARQTDKRGNRSVWAEATTIKDTSKPPVPTITGPKARWTIGSTRVSWEGKTARYDVSYLEAVSGSRLGSLLLPPSMQDIAATSLLRSQPLGTTDCYSVRAHDAANNRSFWSERLCSSRPFDDRKLNPSGSWSKRTGDEYWQGTVRRTSSKGADLALAKTTVQRIALVATTCDRCGRLAVSVGGVRVGVFDLHGSRMRHHRVLKLALPSAAVGRVLLTTLSRRLVEVDGLGVSRI